MICSYHTPPPVSRLKEPSIRPQPKQSQTWRKTIDKIQDITKKILIGLLGTALFATNPTLFSMGFVMGVIWDKTAQEIIDKITRIWKRQPLNATIFIGIASFLALQVTWATASVLFAANLGTKMSHSAR